jgi:hypothetical protein
VYGGCKQIDSSAWHHRQLMYINGDWCQARLLGTNSLFLKVCITLGAWGYHCVPCVSWHVVTDPARRRQNSHITPRQLVQLLEIGSRTSEGILLLPRT